MSKNNPVLRVSKDLKKFINEVKLARLMRSKDPLTATYITKHIVKSKGRDVLFDELIEL